MKQVFLLSFPLVILLNACQYVHSHHLRGSGHTSTEQRNVTGFTGIETRGAIDIIVSQGNFGVKIEADDNILQYIESVVENGKLVLRFREDISLTDFQTAKAYVSAPVLHDFETHGSGNITAQGDISDSNHINVQVAGSGDIELALHAPEIFSNTNGSGTIKLTGDSKRFTCKTNGSGDVHAGNLKSGTVSVSIHGSGNSSVFAADALEVEIFGSGDVQYGGQPTLHTNIHGSGTVSKS